MILNDVIPSSIHSKQKVHVKCDDCEIEYESRFDRATINYQNYGKHKCKKCSLQGAADKRRGIKRPKEVTEKARQTHLETIKKKYPNFTITCKCCQKEFVVPYGCRDRIYCGRSCQSKSVTKTDIRTISVCIVCKKEFKHYGERILCSRECLAKYMSEARIGENNPAHKNAKIVKRTCLFCKKEFEYSRSNLKKGQQRVFCSLACSHQIDLKGNSQGGTGNPYPFGWNKLKKVIRERDDFTCQLCGVKEGKVCHHVHHIDYDKKHLEPANLITLCQKCHNMTHHGRAFWEIIFSGMISGSKIVKKPWGAEIHIANSNEYCLKYLIFFKQKQFSHHSHNLKKELWHCVYGKMECVLENNAGKQYFIFNQGDKIEIQPNIIHQLQAIKNTILVEVSSRDYPEDSYRQIEGANS